MSEHISVIDINSIIRILPQKPPAVLVDRVIDVEPGERILTAKNLSATEPFFDGHFPGQPILPPSILIEVMVQSCTLLAYATEHWDTSQKVISLVGINKTKFHRTLFPGHIIEVEAEFLRKRSNVWRFKVVAYESDQSVADSEVVISIRDRDDII